jgi:hypothetical protein
MVRAMTAAPAIHSNRLSDLDQTKSYSMERYREKMKEGHLRLLQLQHALKDTKRSVVIVVEGPDAAGKGGAIKRLVERLDPRHLRGQVPQREGIDAQGEHGRETVRRGGAEVCRRHAGAVVERDVRPALLRPRGDRVERRERACVGV